MAESEEINKATKKLEDISLKTDADETEKYVDCDNEIKQNIGKEETLSKISDSSESVSSELKSEDNKQKNTNKEQCDSEEEYFSVGEDDNEDEEEEEEDDVKVEKIDEDEYKRTLEETLSDDEKLERKNKSQECKDEGNKFFRESEFNEAIDKYSEALKICPFAFPKERSIMYSNRGACHMKLENNEEAIKDCSSAIDLHPHYLKAVLRRAELYEKIDKLDEALADYQKAVELDPTQNKARITAMRLADQIKDRNEKMKTEMLGKLKDLGNLVLKPFGLSTDNFQLQQGETGSYSVNFKQN
ncbi:tetratricopeptide repeat protein 1 [Patella vulgata]|uniref:tetratricopeptide repeat protein 1 n=1 Tax=Patella vulgata TaxID=6465 RepID=UPI0024A9215B|nr:tetratricopeptide repeat protein 1 [Patella vulgata]XP_050399440.2 tetratricopeptide repeat protein 1 [Patella vulgata]XP_050399441.2 tetratricopeptide repeat protein 1 [Patella vulgata]XP_050399442.2 tetratricopeptide repeat protein 1 [Patella vulgata]